MELEETIKKVDRIRIDFFDSKYKDIHTENELAEKYEALCTILQYIKYDSIPKKKIEDKKQWLKENILENDYANELDKDIAEYQVNILDEILEDKSE